MTRVPSVILAIILVTIVCSFPLSSRAQRRRMTDQQVARIVPAAYFQGQSAPTQMRNATAMRLGEDRHVIAGLVDTSGYAADVRAKYEGFLITDLSSHYQLFLAFSGLKRKAEADQELATFKELDEANKHAPTALGNSAKTESANETDVLPSLPAIATGETRKVPSPQK